MSETRRRSLALQTILIRSYESTRHGRSSGSAISRRYFFRLCTAIHVAASNALWIPM